jgi:hypothetical protein
LSAKKAGSFNQELIRLPITFNILVWEELYIMYVISRRYLLENPASKKEQLHAEGNDIISSPIGVMFA